MRIRKVISGITAGLILIIPLLGFLQVNNVVNNSISLVRAAIPYPGKTVILVEKIIKFNPFKSTRPKEQQKNTNNKDFGLIFYFLSTIVVYNEKILIILVILGFIINKCRNIKVFKYIEMSRPPDIQYYTRWRFKFITPVQKCIQYLSEKYDINPLRRDIAGTGMSLNSSPQVL